MDRKRQKQKHALRSIDLFSGCGGIAYGLRDVCRTVAFCDIKVECRLCLQDNMQRGYLDKAPIYKNVACLPHRLPDFDVLCAGFPCKNISGMGDRKGLQGKYSGLLTHALDVVERHEPKFVFLENVANICSMPGVWRYLINRLHTLGYDAQWTTLAAADVGALHKRNRWFFLAKKRSAPLLCLAEEVEVLLPTEKPALERMVKTDTLKARHRLTMLGNVCIPQQARTAWNFLMQWHPESRWECGKPCAKLNIKRMPTCGAARGGQVYTCQSLPKPFASREAHITLVPKDTGPTNQRLAKRVTEPLILKRWATPRACMGLAPSGHRTGIAKNLTVRSKNDIQTQVRFEKTTVDGFQRRLVNPLWLEQLMGLPPHFTNFTD